MDLVVQIINYNSKEYLKNCLEGLLKDSKDSIFEYKVAVLDNGSKDDLTSLSEHYKNKVNFYYSDKNLGFGKGHNYLATKSTSNYILLLNPDLDFIENRTIERLLNTIKSSKENKVVAPRLLTTNMRVQWWDHGELYGLGASLARSLALDYWKPNNIISKVAWVSGAAFLIERETFDKVTGFDEDFFMYGEDTELCARIRKIGGKIIYNPTVSIVHYANASSGMSLYILKSINLYLDKHYKGPEFIKHSSLFLIRIGINIADKLGIKV